MLNFLVQTVLILLTQKYISLNETKIKLLQLQKLGSKNISKANRNSAVHLYDFIKSLVCVTDGRSGGCVGFTCKVFLISSPQGAPLSIAVIPCPRAPPPLPYTAQASPTNDSTC